MQGAEDYPRTLSELERRFSAEEACRECLRALRWPDGFVCPRGHGEVHWAAGRLRRVCWLRTPSYGNGGHDLREDADAPCPMVPGDLVPRFTGNATTIAGPRIPSRS
ncbi:MAG: transposase [Phycisphaerae bacterium]|nr:transposase [Phycisphaerae bacterium]